jgi:hypothetical protein
LPKAFVNWWGLAASLSGLYIEAKRATQREKNEQVQLQRAASARSRSARRHPPPRLQQQQQQQRDKGAAAEAEAEPQPASTPVRRRAPLATEPAVPSSRRTSVDGGSKLLAQNPCNFEGIRVWRDFEGSRRSPARSWRDRTRFDDEYEYEHATGSDR